MGQIRIPWLLMRVERRVFADLRCSGRLKALRQLSENTQRLVGIAGEEGVLVREIQSRHTIQKQVEGK